MGICIAGSILQQGLDWVLQKTARRLDCQLHNRYCERMITRKGEITRNRIVAAAARLMYERGVANTRTEDIQAAASVSASQLYHYFADKQSLTRAVIKYQTSAIVQFHKPLLARLDNLDSLRAWADVIAGMLSSNAFRGGCPLGSLASELADSDGEAREDLVDGYRQWQSAIRDGLSAMQDRGDLVQDADVDRLATALLTAVQGGLLLGKTLHDSEPLTAAMNIVIDHIATFATR